MKRAGRVEQTESEKAFETFLSVNNLPFQRIERQAVRTPDYLVQVGDLKLIFEVKQLDEDENFGMVSTHTVGDHIRHKIARAHDQVKWGANQGIPSILLVYNNLDPMHMFGTQDHDFLHAMYGEHTVDINKSTGKITDSYYGANQSLHENRDSFSAIGRLAPISGKLTVKLFESAYARVKLPFDLLPPCFDVQLGGAQQELSSFVGFHKTSSLTHVTTNVKQIRLSISRREVAASHVRLSFQCRMAM